MKICQKKYLDNCQSHLPIILSAKMLNFQLDSLKEHIMWSHAHITMNEIMDDRLISINFAKQNRAVSSMVERLGDSNG